MALIHTRSLSETLLELPPDGELLQQNHIFEPEYHQAIYVDACNNAAGKPGAIMLGDPGLVTNYPYRGSQPDYADDENDPDSLEYEGLVLPDGTVLDDAKNGTVSTRPVCALKSIAVRWGYVDLSSARSVSRSFHEKKKEKSGVVNGDLLINSTGDGTIGRVAVYNEQFPALVDGHITIVRLKNPKLAWYIAAYLLSKEGQRQIYRYINGSSGQVEIYPQDIARLWIPLSDTSSMQIIGKKLEAACIKYREFSKDIRQTLNMVESMS
ncbi:restriction endonuclease subunit S [Bradyrhizobium murdochi]|uniref:restriction endonuclease subunit S n=1 Tax=Bradyrhizobium murdochi TaxID=1038859 RepID=UPI000481CD45|nr:restriction endonuclease subunit S [Bradyrhizobium murdochi]